MSGKFAEPLPKDTFEETINFVFEILSSSTKERITAFASGDGHQDTKRSMVLCPEHIREKFQIARSGPWTLEQVLWIVDSIQEAHFSAYLDDVDSDMDPDEESDDNC
jgi:hypothetical protein